MDPVIAEVLSWAQTVFSAALGLLVGFLTARLHKHKDEARRIEERQDAANKALCCLVRDKIIAIYDSHFQQHTPMTLDNMHQLTELYNSYKALGGDGVIDTMYEKLMSISVTVINDDTEVVLNAES